MVHVNKQQIVETVQIVLAVKHHHQYHQYMYNLYNLFHKSHLTVTNAQIVMVVHQLIKVDILITIITKEV